MRIPVRSTKNPLKVGIFELAASNMPDEQVCRMAGRLSLKSQQYRQIATIRNAAVQRIRDKKKK